MDTFSSQPVFQFKINLGPRPERKINRIYCLYMEWAGVHSDSPDRRLLGHYRLHRHFAKTYHMSKWPLPVTEAYVLNYKTQYNIKRIFLQTLNIIYTIMAFGLPLGITATEHINRILVEKHPEILIKFLNDSQNNFDAAIRQALESIHNPAFYEDASPKTDQTQPSPTSIEATTPLPATLVEKTIEETVATPPSQELPPPHLIGKQKDIFSKKQVLILLDIMSHNDMLEPIPLSNPAKYQSVALFLQAITGKSADSWVQELNDYRNGKLYDCSIKGEYRQLLSTMTQLAGILEKGGQESLSELVTQKINQLKKEKGEPDKW